MLSFVRGMRSKDQSLLEEMLRLSTSTSVGRYYLYISIKV